MSQIYTTYTTVETARADGADWELCWLPLQGLHCCVESATPGVVDASKFAVIVICFGSSNT
jgi:hypothetical protein